MLENLSDNSTISSSNDKDVLGVGVGSHRDVGDHLLVRELVSLGGLDDAVQDEDVSVSLGREDENVLEKGLFGVKNLLDPDREGERERKKNWVGG